MAARPGLRVPGAVDGFELAVRAIVGQQVSVARRPHAGRRGSSRRSATPLDEAGRRADAPPSRPPQPLAEADLDGDARPDRRPGPRAAGARGRGGATAGCALDPGGDRDEARPGCSALPGVGPWTAEYVAMRALADPDAWPGTDLVLRRRLAARGGDPERWRPWRAYGAVHLWNDDEQDDSGMTAPMEESA